MSIASCSILYLNVRLVRMRIIQYQAHTIKWFPENIGNIATRKKADQLRFPFLVYVNSRFNRKHRVMFIAYIVHAKNNLQLGDEVDGVLDSGDGGGFFFRDFSVEFLFNSHDQFDSVERVGSKVIDERGRRNNLVSIHTELLDNDGLDLCLKVSRHEKGAALSARHKCRGRGEGSSAGNKGKGDDGLEHGENGCVNGCCRLAAEKL